NKKWNETWKYWSLDLQITDLLKEILLGRTSSFGTIIHFHFQQIHFIYVFALQQFFLYLVQETIIDDDCNLFFFLIKNALHHPTIYLSTIFFFLSKHKTIIKKDLFSKMRTIIIRELSPLIAWRDRFNLPEDPGFGIYHMLEDLKHNFTSAAYEPEPKIITC
ncbi:hypothetical protein ACJX0J_026462, partial [Zea mays]